MTLAGVVLGWCLSHGRRCQVGAGVVPDSGVCTAFGLAVARQLGNTKIFFVCKMRNTRFLALVEVCLFQISNT